MGDDGVIGRESSASNSGDKSNESSESSTTTIIIIAVVVVLVVAGGAATVVFFMVSANQRSGGVSANAFSNPAYDSAPGSTSLNGAAWAQNNDDGINNYMEPAPTNNNGTSG